MNTPEPKSVIAAVDRAIKTTTGLRTILLWNAKASARAKIKNLTRKRTQKAKPTDASQAVQVPSADEVLGRLVLEDGPPSGESARLLASLPPDATFRRLVELGLGHGARTLRKIEIVKDLAAKELKRSRRQHVKSLDAARLEAAEARKKEVEVELSGCEDFLSSLLPEQKSYPEILKAIESGDITQLEEVIHELRKVKGKLEVEAVSRARAGMDQKANEHGQPSETHASSEPRPKSVREWASDDRITLAIVFTDVVGSTTLRAQIGDECMGEMLRAHFDQGRRLIKKYAGQEVKTTGDGFLAVFRSTDKALDFAMALHSDPGNQRIQMRAGIHLGEVTVQDQDIDGTSVHFASRVIGVVREPEIWLSDEAHRAIENHRTKRHSHLQWERHDGVKMKDFPDSTLWSLAAPAVARLPVAMQMGDR